MPVLDGFIVEGREIPRPLVPIDTETRDRLQLSLAAVMLGKTPEQVLDYLEDGFPSEVYLFLAAPHAAVEVNDHIDVLLCVMQSPAA